MLILNITDKTIKDDKLVFPNTSIPPTGLDDDFLSSNGYARFSVYLDHNKDTQTLEHCEPYQVDGKWLTVRVRDLTSDELLAKAKALVPSSITPRQARLKLLEADLLDNLEAVITTNRAWQIEWEYATEVKRDSPLIDAVAVQAGLTELQIDTMFIEASKL